MKSLPYGIWHVALILLLLPGCGRLIDWGTETFNQGEKREMSRTVINDHFRTVNVYNEFGTAGLFDILWLSNEVRTVYADLNASFHGKTTEAHKSFLRRQLAENDNFISFYVLAVVQQNVAPLGDKQSPWNIRLRVNGQLYAPRDIKDVELNPEYEYLLKDHWTRFRTVYHVKFPRKDLEGNEIITEDTKHIILHLQTIDRFDEAEWVLDEQGKLIIPLEDDEA
ncbi:hypothetical protein JW872_02825 [Candidatus Babeliales bacterium]|nr:hypothetical protein [Candidatus Babeliales bacterium]